MIICLCQISGKISMLEEAEYFNNTQKEKINEENSEIS